MSRSEVLQKLRSEVVQMEGFRPSVNTALDFSLGPLRDAFQFGTFPVGAVHEFICHAAEDVASTCGFISGLLSILMRRGGICLWVNTSRAVFPPSLRNSGLVPDRFIFVDVRKDADVCWVMDEALKCDGL